ncbi:hypothetical protein V2J09_012138 [Rumex salicifolius]
MLILSRKCISKTRVFLCPAFLFSQSFSAVATSVAADSTFPSFSDSARASGIPTDSIWDVRRAVNPLKAWFLTAKNPLLDRIFEILSSRDEEDVSSVRSADFALAKLNLRLSELFVLEVLRYGTDVLACLKFFDWAGRQRGFQHSRATFHAIFKILSRAKLMPLMLDFLGTFKAHHNVYKARYYDTLVIGYAVAGKPELALELLGRMRFQGLDLDSLPYNVLLNSLVENGFFDIADVVLNQMKIRGHNNDVTDTIVMKSFCKQNQFDKAEEYLRQMISNQPVVNDYIVEVLVDSLCRKNRFEDAERLVNELRGSGCVSMNRAYDVWLKGLVRAGKSEIALGFLQEIKAVEGYTPEVFRYNMLIFQLLKENRLKEVFDLLTDMREDQVVPDKATMNAVMCFFCKAGMVDVALELYNLRFEFGLTPSSMVYNYLVNSLCGYGNIDEAFHILKSAVEQGQFHSKKTFWILADGLCREGKFDKMMDLLVLALEHNFKPNDFLYNKMISALCRDNRVEEGYLLHAELNRLKGVTNDKTYRQMISGFNVKKRGDIAARLLVEMQEKGHEPKRGLVRAVVQSLFSLVNAEWRFFQLLEMQLQMARKERNCYTYNLFIDAAGHMGRPDLARKVFEIMRANGVDPNLDSDILMLQSYLKSESISDAECFFRLVSKRRELKRKLYHTMIVGLCKARRAEHALSIMREANEIGLIPSLNCYEELMYLHCGERQYDKAVQLFNEMEKAGRFLSSYIGNMFLMHSLRSRDLYDAWIHWRDVSRETPSSAMLGELIATFSSAYSSGCQARHLEEAIQECFPLDVFTYNLLLRRLCVDRINEAIELFFKMCRKGYEPNRWTYEALVRGLVLNGRRSEAMKLLDDMGHQIQRIEASKRFDVQISLISKYRLLLFIVHHLVIIDICGYLLCLGDYTKFVLFGKKHELQPAGMAGFTSLLAEFACERRKMRFGNASATSTSSSVHDGGAIFRWNSATPYLTGGIVFITLLIAVAVIVLFCQDRRRSSSASDSAGEKSSGGAQISSAAASLPEFVVIMAGDDKPTYLAMPVVASSSPEAAPNTNSLAGEENDEARSISCS